MIPVKNMGKSFSAKIVSLCLSVTLCMFHFSAFSRYNVDPQWSPQENNEYIHETNAAAALGIVGLCLSVLLMAIQQACSNRDLDRRFKEKDDRDEARKNEIIQATSRQKCKRQSISTVQYYRDPIGQYVSDGELSCPSGTIPLTVGCVPEVDDPTQYMCFLK